MFSASIVDCGSFEAVDARSLVPVVAATPKPGGGHWKYRQAKQAARPGCPGGKNSGLGGVQCEATEEDYRSA
ncbi:hypothetical protein L3Q82_000291 [Scortum barcoo]|uniref:Uncharacterized protein n=1 Tax=Scortum barcoo TaxID=214431 RepID=A0ACB8XAY9_9TELE|nr:hypothetical protein L3Q82_000291 [Scortum barcoo]